MSQPPRGLATGAALAVGTGTLVAADATFAGCAAATSGSAAGGSAGGGETGEAAGAAGVAGGGEAGAEVAATVAFCAAGAISLRTVAIVVMFAALGPVGVSCRLSEGTGDSEAA